MIMHITRAVLGVYGSEHTSLVIAGDDTVLKLDWFSERSSWLMPSHLKKFMTNEGTSTCAAAEK